MLQGLLYMMNKYAEGQDRQISWHLGMSILVGLRSEQRIEIIPIPIIGNKEATTVCSFPIH